MPRTVSSHEPVTLTRKKLERLTGDPVKSASAVHLIYQTDAAPGILRERQGSGFSYRYRGKEVTAAKHLERIRKLAIPPAWEHVWIAANPDGHLQATGIDTKGRKQYRYHSRWTAVRNSTKFHHLHAFGTALPQLRSRLKQDLSAPTLSKAKVLATVVEVMQETGIRIGNGAYEKLYGSYGLTTLKDKHVKMHGGRVQFAFRGKKGIYHTIGLESKRLSRIVVQCRDIPGQELFQYRDADGVRHAIDSGAVNAYIKEAAGGAFTAKDFRTWKGTLHALAVFRQLGCSNDEKETKKRVLAMLDAVAEKLGNTRTVCRKYYVHPTVVDLFCSGKLAAFFKEEDAPQTGLSAEERLLLRLLETAASKATV